MDCFYPISIYDKKSPIIGKKINVPCGKCPACMTKLRASWSFRMQKELENSGASYFVTLTYDDEHIPIEINNNQFEKYYTTLKKNDLIKYFKRLRKKERKLRYFACGEYGSNFGRPHYHAIVFNIDDRDNIHQAWEINGEEIGRSHAVVANDATIHYVTKYMINPDLENVKNNYDEKGKQRPFRIMSKGLGKGYVTTDTIKYHLDNKELSTRSIKGFIQPLPRYLKEIIFDEGQLRVLNKLARKKAVEKAVDISHEDWVSMKRNLKYLVKQKSKTKDS